MPTSITAQKYNTLRTLVNKILGTSLSASETYGYGQSFNTSAVTGDYETNTSSTDKVTAQQYEDLYIDIIRIKAHQVGTGAVSVDPFVLGDYDTNGGDTDLIELAYINGLESLGTTIDTDRFSIDTSGQAQVINLETSASIPLTSTRSNSVSGNWNGTLTHIFDVEFPTGTERREFFNAGGEVRFSANVSYTGSQAKTVDWQTEMSDMGVTSFRATTTINNNSQGSNSNNGNFDLTGSYKLCYSKSGGSSYARNDYRIEAQSMSDDRIRFKVSFNDNRPNNTTWGIDETVLGDFTSTIELLQPIGTVTINGTAHNTVNIPDANLPFGTNISNL